MFSHSPFLSLSQTSMSVKIHIFAAQMQSAKIIQAATPANVTRVTVTTAKTSQNAPVSVIAAGQTIICFILDALMQFLGCSYRRW